MPKPVIEIATFKLHDADICTIAKESRYTRDFTSHRFFRDDIENTYRKGEVSVAKIGEEVVGFIYCKHLIRRSTPWSVVHYMGVLPNLRTIGVGRLLLDWSVKTSPHFRVQLSCEHSNTEGMKFYERCGFTRLHEGVYGIKSPRPYTRWERTVPSVASAAAVRR
jgi:ribosomal protein S18 acetylase RimI-like enzyme